MNTTELNYPVFEANQVLTNAHLNELFEYLDEQERLTRVNLIGIGIACGLDVQLDTATSTIHLTKGCGDTTQGYLIVEPEDVDLVAWRQYKLPPDPGYELFVDPATNKQYDLWELFPADEPDTQQLSDGALVLEDKAFVLFLELSKDDLRNCSPNNCDDRGAEVTATVRCLLIDIVDLDKVIARASEATSGLVATDFGAELTERLELPDLRMPRVDVPNSRPVMSEEVLAAFQEAFRQDQLAAKTAAALTAVYDAFKPLVANDYPNDPFANFANTFGFLDATPTLTSQVHFIQYYWDLFDDLLAAYDAVRWKGVDLMCACCPPEGLFPRHLMAGVLAPATVADPEDYRHRWVPSPAVGDCAQRTEEWLVLFRRLVAMAESFTEAPPMPARGKSRFDRQIRITPSMWGDAPLSAKAIPYYYEQDGAPPLYELWDPVKSARRRANQNLSYRSDEYQPAAPSFVTDPLRFDLEPHNFLRIEGHLGKDVSGVLSTLLTLKDTRRLPIDVIALRTGAFDEKIEVDLTKEQCRFEDLETLYATLRAELICFVCKEVRYFYDFPFDYESNVKQPAVPSLPLLRTCAPDFRVQPGTIGRWIDDVRAWMSGLHVGFLFIALPRELAYHAYALVGALPALPELLGDDIRHVDFTGFAERYRQLVDVAEQFETARRAGIEDGLPGFDTPGLTDRLNEILLRCRVDPFQALAEEYKRRVREVKQAQFMSHFVAQHPGIQHKAGVPLGGTFILVYHDLPEQVVDPAVFDLTQLDLLSVLGATTFVPREAEVVGERARPADEPPPRAEGDLEERRAAYEAIDATASSPSTEARQPMISELGNAFTRLQFKEGLADDPDVQLIYRVLTGKELVERTPPTDAGQRIYVDAVAELGDGTVIADFFLPYLCCSECAPIQYSLPPAGPQLDARIGCTNVDGMAEVVVTPHGATGEVSVQVDDGPFEESTGTLLLATGTHTIVIRDETGAESAPTQIIVPPQLTIGTAQTVLDDGGATYHVVFDVSGGTPPYRAEPGHFLDSTYTSPPVALGETITVTVVDAVGCTLERTFQHSVDNPCGLPCDGIAILRGHRFWIPEPKPQLPVNGYSAEVKTFNIEDPNGQVIDLTADVNTIVNTAPNPIRSTNFDSTVQKWMTAINDRITDASGSDQWVHVEYEPAPEGATTGTLWIDRLDCLEFTFVLNVSFAQAQTKHELVVGYDARGTIIRDLETNSRVRIPPYDGAKSDKCHPDEPAVPLCDDVSLDLKIAHEGGALPEPLTLTAIPSGSDAPVGFLWEVQDATPALANGEKVQFQFDPVEPVEKLVTLTAFTEDGCTVVLRQTLNIADPHG
jgi:hypothetical protein